MKSQIHELKNLTTVKMSKSNKTIRSMAAMMAIFFAVAATSCQKENEISPATPTPTPVIPVTPAVSTKPTFILTTENGSSVRKQVYLYDVQGKLTKYESLSSASTSDSVSLANNSMAFFRHGSATVSQVLTLNADKTFKSLFFGDSQIDFANNQAQLRQMQRLNAVGSTVGIAEFVYSGNNLITIGPEIRIDINYYNNLPYQKGINEIPFGLKPIKFYKILEMENATSTVLYNKLISQAIIAYGGSRFETHDYTYVFDNNNRVTEINEIITTTTPTSTSQRILSSIVSY
jgi:hypothetical protein